MKVMLTHPSATGRGAPCPRICSTRRPRSALRGLKKITNKGGESVSIACCLTPVQSAESLAVVGSAVDVLQQTSPELTKQRFCFARPNNHRSRQNRGYL